MTHLLTARTLGTYTLTLTVLTAGMFPTAARGEGEKTIAETAVAAGGFQTLVKAAQAAGLVEALSGEGPLTVFAPTDEAFAKLPAGTVEGLLKPENKAKLAAVLKYHVVSGRVPAAEVVKLRSAATLNGQRVDISAGDQGVQVDKASVVKTDIECSNGLIHVLDGVLLPNFDNIPATARQAGEFGTLLAAAQAAGLVEALSGEGPLTVFAPTDEAFAKLPEGTVANLLKPENKAKLAAILKYHVVAGRIFSADALKAGKAGTLQGGKLSIRLMGTEAKVNDATLVATDIDASNGVIHVIDRVLLPPAKASKVGAKGPKQLIEDAVRQGSHLYNQGHHAACGQLYHQTMQQLMRESLTAHAAAAVRSSLAACEHVSCATQRAWTLRRGLDTVYVSLTR